MKTNDELIEEFRNGGEYWIKICDAFRMGDGERAHSLISMLLTQKDAEVRDSERNRIFSIMRGMGVKFDGGEVMKTYRKWEYTRNKHASEVTNKGDTNN